MNALPGKARQIGPDDLRFLRPFEYLSHSDRADPQVSRGVNPQPTQCGSRLPCRQFSEQIDQKRRIKQAFSHLRDMRKRESPIRSAASTSTSEAVTKGSSRIS